jgi:hypothetical protein
MLIALADFQFVAAIRFKKSFAVPGAFLNYFRALCAWLGTHNGQKKYV